jgi:predicted HAD superfamily Cof-like phosphohydrolase
MQDVFADAAEFTAQYVLNTGKKPSGKINREFITKMVMDELEELKDAKDEAEEVDALLDAMYYIVQHLATTGLDVRPIWKLIHQANMTKFGEGGYVDPASGKWMKPPNFEAPDEAIRKEIARQRQRQLRE